MLFAAKVHGREASSRVVKPTRQSFGVFKGPRVLSQCAKYLRTNFLRNVWIAYLPASGLANQGDMATHQFRKGILASSTAVGSQQFFIIYFSNSSGVRICFRAASRSLEASL